MKKVIMFLLCFGALASCTFAQNHYPVASNIDASGKILYEDYKETPPGDPQVVTIQRQVVIDYQCIPSPGNPPTGLVRLYCDSGTGNLTCLTSSGGSCLSAGGGGVTSIATTGPITGGTITTTGTLACPSCVVATTPGAGLAHFAGATQTVTSSAVNLAADVTGQLPIGSVGSAGLSGTSPVTVNSAGAIGCATCNTTAATVTSFSAGTLSPLFTTSVATATTTPALTFSLTNAAAGTVFGNATGSAAGATFTSTPTLGVSGTAGTMAMFPASGNFTTTWGSAATASNTILGFATVPTNGHVVTCTVASTTCTLTDGGAPATGTVTSVATTAPITGGTFTTTGTIACATCVTSASSLANGGVVLGTAGTQASGTNTALTFSAPTLTVGLAGTSSGILGLTGSTSGSATFTAPAVAGTSTNAVTMSNVLLGPSGAAGTPTYGFTSQTNYGFYLNAVPTVAIAINGTNPMAWFTHSVLMPSDTNANTYGWGGVGTGTAVLTMSQDNVTNTQMDIGTSASNDLGTLGVSKVLRIPQTGTNTAGFNTTIQGGNGTGTGKPGLIFDDGAEISSVSSSSAGTIVHRQGINDTKVLSTTTATATTIMSLNVAANQRAAVILRFAVHATDGTNSCVSAGEVTAVAENTSGTIKSGVNATTGFGNTSICTGSDTLALVFAITAANPAVLSVAPAWVTLVPTSVYITFNYDDLSDASATP